MYPTLRDIDVTDKRVLLNAELNVPLKNGEIVDDFRIRKALPTMKEILSMGARQLVIISHLSPRIDGKKVEESLKMLVPVLTERLGEPVRLIDPTAEPVADRIVLLDNVRLHKGEKENDPEYAKQLARHGDVFINDAFGTMHREFASFVALPALFTEKAIGLLVEKELTGLDFTSTERPFIVILGCAKISDKIQLLEQLLERCDTLLLGGAIVFTFLKAKGLEVGASLCEEEHVETARRLLDTHGEKIMLPIDIVISEELEGNEIFTVDVDKIPPGMKGLDIGDASVEVFKETLSNAATVFWNGPLGVFEVSPFDTATAAIAGYLAKSRAKVVVGGGDTAEAMRQMGYADYYAHVSTGGGASIKYIAGDTLPGLDALKQ